MKAKIHPTWYENAEVLCACGNKFNTGATVEKIEVEICSACHPFYTGKMKYVDTAGRVDAFKEKQSKAKAQVMSKAEKRKLKREKRIQKELERPGSLAELRKQIKSKKQSKKKS
jgi:large subunit ribosomal protein L31